MDDNTTNTPTQTPAPEAPKAKKKNWFMRHKFLTAILAVIVIAAVASGSGDKNNTTQTDNNTTPAATDTADKPEEKTDTTAKIGQAVRDGKFEFTVNKLTCGEASVGSEFLRETAQGQFCRVNITVKNIGNEAQTLSHSDQYAYNAAGQKYSANSTAAIYANSGSDTSTWYNEINPGNTVSGDIFFDVPKDVTPVTVELHDSAFSGGIKVSLQ